MPAVTPTLEARAASSTSAQASASSSFLCSGSNSLDSRCETGSSETALEIGLGVGIPVFVIACVLGFFVFRNYRKEKKEAMVHDPDFDETGDATALPDFPAFSKEDPFRSHSSVSVFGAGGGYPLILAPNRSAHDLGSVASPARDQRLLHIDPFVLPYQTQLGSKASLHDFAYSHTDLKPYHKRRGSDYLSFTALAPSTRESPVKAGLGAHIMGRDAAGTPADYKHLHSSSAVLLGPHTLLSSKDTSGDSADAHTAARFGLQYEGELKTALLPTRRSSRRSASLSLALRGRAVSDLESVGDSDFGSDDGADARFHDATLGKTVPSAVVASLSPFEDSHTDPGLPSPDVEADPVLAPREPREPRMLQFDMLQNVSDDEEPLRKMTDEQEEELARMKSVYKVYFDRPNSVASQGDNANQDVFEADPLAPLPVLDMDRLHINAELRGDTAYDRRKTATSLIYADGMGQNEGHIMHPHQQFLAASAESHPDPQAMHAAPLQQEYPQEYPQEYSLEYLQPFSPGQTVPPEHVPSGADLLPLKSLPNPSDIRNSTLETYTLYEPTLKVTSPPMRSPQGYFDPPNGSPHMGSQASFSTAGLPRSPYFGELPPVIRENSNGSNGATPLASQLSRTSVVMLNPVSEITSLRKFKPAGSLPSGIVPPRHYSADGLSSVDDLVAENRKSVVRRMMNSNF